MSLDTTRSKPGGARESTFSCSESKNECFFILLGPNKVQ